MSSGLGTGPFIKKMTQILGKSETLNTGAD